MNFMFSSKLVFYPAIEKYNYSFLRKNIVLVKTKKPMIYEIPLQGFEQDSMKLNLETAVPGT